MKINEGYKEKGKGRKCNETNEEKDSRMVDDSRTGAQCGDSAYAGEGGRGGCGNRSFDTWKASSQGYTLVDKNGQPFQIHGVSTHGLQWFGQYNNKAAYQTLRDDWGANAIRLAMYVDEGGYYSDRNGMKKKSNRWRAVCNRAWHVCDY